MSENTGRTRYHSAADIDLMREHGATWADVAEAFGMGSETSARRWYKKLTRGKTFAAPVQKMMDAVHEHGWEVDWKPAPGAANDPAVTWSRPVEKILFVPDAHIPYENKESWALMMAAARTFRPDHIVVIGDFGDFKAVSSHLKDPQDKTRLKWEVETVNSRLDELDALNATNKIFIAGNHESRLQRYLQERAPELFDFLSVPQLYRLDERGWKYVPYMEHITLGALRLTHDVGTTGIGSARKAMDTFQHSVVTGHAHRLQYVVEGDATGGARVSALFGWLGDIDEIDYMSRARAARDWAQGFGVGYLNPTTGAVHLVPVPIVLGTVVVEGTLYEIA